jgi:hypothetical protein
MLPLDDDARAALEQNHKPGYRVSAFYGSDLTLDSVPVTFDGSLSYSGDAAIQGTGSVYLARDGGESLIPQGKTDPLAPYGQELQIDRTVTVGDQTWQIPLGRFRIARIPSAREYFRRYPTAARRVGWAVQLELKDRFDIIEADDFLSTTSPVPGNTTWAEIQRLSPIPILASLPDQPLPSGLVYDSRAKAIATLMDNLGGVPHMTRQGVLTARKRDAWLTETVPAFTIRGTIAIDDGMSNELYNSVVVTTSQDPEIVGYAEIGGEFDPLSVNSPLRRRTYRKQLPIITSQEAADEAARTILARVSTRQSRTARITCLPRPDIELGDYGVVVDPISGREVAGEVSAMTFSLDPTESMTLTMIVAETR